MLNTFHLTALTKVKGQMQLLHIPLLQSLQDELSETWAQQYDDFTVDVKTVRFDPGYTPEENERFSLKKFTLPDEFKDVTSLTAHTLDPISNHEDQIDSIRAIVGFAQDDEDAELVLFQNFSRSHVIRPGRFLFLQNNTYKTVAHRGMTLDQKLSAVYTPEAKELLFASFRTTNTFLPLSDFYKEASEEEIRDVLEHDLIAAEDADALAVDANQWFRKRFAMLRDSGILDHFTAKDIKKHARNYDLDIELDGDKIVFPADKAAAKRLLQFLNEEIFRGAITDTLYETNSKREAD